MSVFFNGRLLVTPTVESQLIDFDMVNTNIAIGNNVAIIGRSSGGTPTTPLALNNPLSAQNALKSGELLEGVYSAFSPGPDIPGPSTIYGVRINPAVQSSATLLDDDSNTVLELTSSDYGEYTNRISIKIESGSTTGKKVTTRLDTKYIVTDNIYRKSFNIQYTGGEASATIDITPTTLILKAPSTAPGVSIDLDSYSTVRLLVDRINSVDGFEASVLYSADNTPTINGLDSVSAQDIKTSIYTVRADLQAIVDYINSYTENFINATRAANAGAPPANTTGAVVFTGGSDGNVTNQDWQNCFDALKSVDVQWIAVLSSDPAVWAMANAHCIYMSGAGKNERRCIVGRDVNTSIETAIGDAISLGSDRTAYCYPGYYIYDSSSNLVVRPPYMLSAIIAGGLAGVSPGSTLTNKTLNISGIEKVHDSSNIYRDVQLTSDTDYFINNGILTLHKKNGFRVTQAISTWTADTKFNKVELSTGAALDFTIKSVRNALEDLLGRKGNALLIASAVSITDTILTKLAESETKGGYGVLAGDSANPAFKNITASFENDVLSVSFQCSPVVPVNFVLITVSAGTFAGSSTVTAI